MRRPSGAFLVAMALLAVAGGVGVWTWHKANSAPNAVRAKGDFWQAVWHHERPRIPHLTREEQARQRELALQSKSRMIERYVLRLVTATRNLSDHYRNLETPTLITETITLLLDLETAVVVFKSLIPESSRSGDLDLWQELLKPGAYSPADFAHLLRGEWHTTSEHWLRKTNPRDPEAPPDPEALADAFAGAYHAQVVKLSDPAADFADLRDLSIYNSSDFPHLSPQSRNVLDTLWIGAGAYAKGYCRAVTILNQYQAAIELLRLERAGTPLVPALCGALTRDPVTGQAFLLDPATRELGAPNGTDSKIIPLLLPR